MEINELIIQEQLIFSSRVCYSEKIILYPILMSDIIKFQLYIESLTVRKDSKFPSKEIIKMSYLDFLYHCMNHPEYEEQYKISNIQYFYMFAANLLSLTCRDQEVKFDTRRGLFYINGEEVDSDKFDDLRRIILIQNGVDFNIDEFMNRDTEEALRKAQEFENRKNNEKSSIEDCIDSVMVGLETSEEYIKNLSIRKFWRIFKRINKHLDYTICKSAELGGMVTFKQPILHWTNSLEADDKYANLKTDKKELKDKLL